MASALFICPCFGQYGYACAALQSYFKHGGSEYLAIVVDDASPEAADWEILLQRLRQTVGVSADKLLAHRFEVRDGLTRSWNYGLTKARELGVDYVVCGNSDILFTPGWDEPLLYGLDHTFRLVGPLSNAPGPTNNGKQDVAHYVPNFRLTDNEAVLADTAAYLRARYGATTFVESNINGFCLMSKTAMWWDGAFDAAHVFDPKHRLTFNEDELQRRWFARQWKAGIAMGSYVFHYRAVTRGDKHRHHGSFRRKDNP